MADQEPGRHLKFREPLGRGGFGTVYLADLRGAQGMLQRVAVKVLHADNPDEVEVSARQRDEARLLAQLNHDHIVKVYDLIEVEGRPAVIMEYIDGVDAETWVKKAGPMPPRAALSVIAGVASALEAAYNAESPVTGRPLRAIHRDVKPANVLISVHGAVKVLDFGVARADLDRDAETRDAHAMGTLAFIAPEQWLHATISSAVDVYALGLTLLRLLTGSVVERIPLNPDRFEARVRELVGALDVPGWPAEWRAQVQELVATMLAWEPERRPSAREIEERALALADGAPGEGLAVLARKQVPTLVDERRRRFGSTSIILPGDVTLMLTTVSPSTAPTLAPRAAATPARRRPLALAIAAGLGGLLVSVALVGAGIWFVLREPAPAPSAPTLSAAAATSPAVVSETRRRGSTALASAPTPAAVSAPAASSARAPTPSAAKTPSAASAPTTTAATSAPSAAKTAPTEPAGGADASATLPIVVSSVPLGAELWVDGQQVGSTPVRGLQLATGEHTLRLVLADGRASEKVIRVSERAPSRFVWRADQDSWESGL